MNAESFISSVGTSFYYAFAGSSNPWTGGTVPALYDNPGIVQFDAYNNMIFGKKLQTTDVSLMINSYQWISGTVYDMYDDRDTTLSTKQFFVWTFEGSFYYVWKCLNNNNAIESTSEPQFSDTGASDIYYETADGYQWKYMYRFSQSIYAKFATDLYIPVVPDSNVTSNAVSGAVDVIVPVNANGIIVSSTGKGYDNYYAGTLTPTSVSNINTPLVTLDSGASTRNDFYTGCFFRITQGTGSGQYKEVTGHVSNNSGTFITLRTKLDTIPDSTSTYTISPGIVVRGAGDDYIDENGAADANIPANRVAAIALINANTGNSIYRVEILDRAVNVMSAGAYVNVSSQVNVTEDAIFKVIIGPKGGHGANVAAELYSSHVGVNVNFANNESNTIPVVNYIQTVGLIANPLFANVAFTTTDLNGVFQVGETVTQTVGSNSASAVITSISPLQVTRATPGWVTSTNSTVGTIIGSTSAANAQINAISICDITKGFGTFQQLYRYNGYYTGIPFTSNEIVYQGANTPLNNTALTQAEITLGYNSSARFHSNNVNGTTVYLTSKLGRINSANTLTGLASDAIFTINTKNEPDLIPESGDVLYLENFDAVTRSNTTSETVKLILSY
jgi:hypothetical protein